MQTFTEVEVKRLQQRSLDEMTALPQKNKAELAAIEEGQRRQEEMAARMPGAPKASGSDGEVA